MTTERIVLCMRWGTLYPAIYVNVLYSAVKSHINGPFRFVCLTDDASGLSDQIESFPIPKLGYGPKHWKHGAWPKLSVFVSDLYGLRGRALFIDLDSVILAPLDPFFEVKGGFVSIAGGKDWRRGSTNLKPSLASGVFAFELGSQTQIADRFRADPDEAYAKFGIEQRFIQEHVTGWQTWPDDWVISFKRHLRQPMLIDRFFPPRDPDRRSKIVAFHGDPRPIEVARSGSTRWARFPRAGRGPIGWVREYWLENGFNDDC